MTTANAVTVVGGLFEDIIVVLRAPFAPGTQTDAVISRNRGGSAANLAARISKQGLSTRFVGSVGADETGSWLVDQLTQAGVDCDVERTGKSASVISLVSVGGERSFITNAAIDPEVPTLGNFHLDASSQRVLHISGHWILDNRYGSDMIAAIANFRSQGGVLSVDLATESRIAEFGAREFGEVIHLLSPTLLFGNSSEADTAGLQSLVPNADFLIVTDGSNPTRVYSSKSMEFAEMPVPRCDNVVDTTGAGDAFCAGFIGAFLQNRSPGDAVRAGHESAYQAIQQIGG